MEKKNVNKREIKNKDNKKEKNMKKKKKKSGILNKILLILLLVLIILVVGIIYKSKQNGGGMTGLLSVLVGHDEETLEKLDPIQVLLMGVSTDNGGKLTDTIIIATYDPKKQTASLLSIPRDTFVGSNPLTGSGYDKINAIYQKKGAEGTLKKVNELTGLEIEYYMIIDNQALIKLVDVIGGVEFDVPIDMKYDDPSQDLHINLKKGQQKLNGDQAEQLLRFRHGNKGETYPKEWGDNDMGRMKTQRAFMIETAKQTLQAKNILKIKEIIDIAYEYVETNLSIATIKDYVPYAINVDINSIQSAVIPGGSYGPSSTPSYPLWFFIANKKGTAELIEELYGTDEEVVENLEEQETETPKVEKEDKEPAKETETTEISKKEASEIKIELLNGTGSAAALTKVKKELTKLGYKVTRTNSTTSISKTKIINKTDVDAQFTDNIKETLGVGDVSTNAVSSSNVDITIIIGKDYNEQ